MKRPDVYDYTLCVIALVLIAVLASPLFCN